MKETLYSNNLPIFSGKNVHRLKNELMNLLDVIDWYDKCKDTIKSNFIYFLECFNNDVSFEGTSIRFCKEASAEGKDSFVHN